MTRLSRYFPKAQPSWLPAFVIVPTAVLVISIVVLAIMAIVTATTLPAENDTFNGWKDVVEVIANAAAPISAMAALFAVLINLNNSSENARVTREAQKANRFQKAAELISDDLQTAEVAGIALLQELAEEDSSRFGEQAVSILKAFIAESLPKELEGRVDPATLSKMPFPRTRIGVIHAIRVVNAIHYRLSRRAQRTGTKKSGAPRRPRGPRPPETIYNLYLARWNREAIFVSELDLRDIVASFWSLTGGAITRCTVHGRVGQKVRLVETDLRGTVFQLKRLDGQPLTPWDTSILQFSRCKSDENTRINRRSLSDWLALAATPRPPAAQLKEFEDVEADEDLDEVDEWGSG